VPEPFVGGQLSDVGHIFFIEISHCTIVPMFSMHQHVEPACGCKWRDIGKNGLFWLQEKGLPKKKKAVVLRKYVLGCILVAMSWNTNTDDVNNSE
jgi:hypothetical protein